MSEAQMQIPYRYLTTDVDRHGNTRVYYRRCGRKIRIREEPGTREFETRYREIEALFAEGRAPPRPRGLHVEPGTLGWLAQAYQRADNPAWMQLEPSTRATRARLLRTMLDEPIYKGAEERYRDFPLQRLRLEALQVLRDRKASHPGAANDRVKALRALFKWAAARRHLVPDPARDLTKLRVVSSGHHTWTLDEIGAFERRHPVGTRANLAMRLMLYTGGRRSDAVRLGRQHLRDGGGRLVWTAYKNRNRHPVTLDLPVLPPLAEALAATPTGELVFLVTEAGQPFSVAGFGNWFRDRCREAGLERCSAHGLRKAAATVAAEAGATAHQLMSMFGWSNLAEAERYTKAAERRRLSSGGMILLADGMRRSLPTVPPAYPSAIGGTN